MGSQYKSKEWRNRPGIIWMYRWPQLSIEVCKNILYRGFEPLFIFPNFSWCKFGASSLSVILMTNRTDGRSNGMFWLSAHLPRCFSCIQSFSWSFTIDLAKDRQQEGCSLPRTYSNKVNLIHLLEYSASHHFPLDRIVFSIICFVYPTCLCAGHEVSLWLDNRDGIFLDRGRSGVATQTNVTHDDLTHVHILELFSKHIYKQSSESKHGADT